MNLSQCPRCGSRWTSGDFCGNCGFVPIGAGLKNQKKKRKKTGRYVDPGSGRGFLAFLFVGGLVGAGFYYKPWADDWAMVRYWMGQGHIHSVKGKWSIVKSVSLNPSAKTVFAQKIGAATLNFDDKNAVNMQIASGEDMHKVQATYVVNGRSVFISKMVSSDGENPLPASIHLDLTWQGPDTVVAGVSKDEVIYLQRQKEKSGISKILQFGTKPGGDVAVPSQFNKMVKGLDKQMKEAEE